MEKLKPAFLVFAFYAAYFGVASMVGLGWALALFGVGLLVAVPISRALGRHRAKLAVAERNRLIEQYYDDQSNR
jgi:hypothetical protein